MDPLYFRGRPRLAAKQLLDHTTLGERLEDDTVDDGELLSVFAPDEVLPTLSTGESTLWTVLQSFAGHGYTIASLAGLAEYVDDETAWCAWWALGVLLDKVVPMAPVDFGGLDDVVRRRS